ncbi:MAG: hypothetical protein JNK82_26050 [Myxococcaceae bacterium]|nr:hypothetical protein [Myxococcaceae bacterium]
MIGPDLELSWQAIADGGPVTVFRRSDAGTFVSTATLDAGTTRWVVANFPANEPREFRVTRLQPGSFSGEGYVLAGRDVRFRDDQREVAVVVDATNVAVNLTLIEQLENDLRDDGWQVVRIVIAAGEGPPGVKARLQQAAAASGRLRAALLLGNVPIAYSGIQAPDGHSDHQGAWAADPYYADLGDAGWTDSSRGGVGQFYNDAGDGKFDPSTTPSPVELAVGRVSFERMPVYGADAGTVQIAKYLEKLHRYRSGELQLPRGGRAQSSFGYFSGEAFSRVAYRDTSAVFGEEAATGGLVSYLTEDAGVILAWGDGPGSSTSAGGIINSTQLASSSPRAVFFGLFGSYFGDWQYTNNLLRAALGSGTVLETFWYARPYQYLYRLGALETFGDAFSFGNQGRLRSMQVIEGLLGDPTLRAFYLPRLASLSAVPRPTGGVSLTWSASAGAEGYVVYRRAGSAAEVRVTAAPLSALTFEDLTAPAGTYEWRVAPAKLETTGSGTFWSHGLGARAMATVTAAMGVDAGVVMDAGVVVSMDGGVVVPDAGTEPSPDAGAMEPDPDGGSTMEPVPDGGYVPLPVEPLGDPIVCGCSLGGGEAMFALLGALSLLLRRRRNR